MVGYYHYYRMYAALRKRDEVWKLHIQILKCSLKSKFSTLAMAAVYIPYMWKLRQPEELLNVFSKLNKFIYIAKSYNLRHVW